MVDIFREVRRVLRKDGTLWLNMGDSYSGSCRGADAKYGNKKLEEDSLKVKPDWSISGLKLKDLCGIPWRVALALQADGWWLRSGIPWVKRSAMPESCSDRPASALEYVFLLTKLAKYYFDMDAIRQEYINIEIESSKRAISGFRDTPPNSVEHSSKGKQRNEFYKKSGRNFRNTDLFFESLEPPFGAIFADDELVGLDINPKGFSEAHFATFPLRLPEVAILAGTSEKGCCAECGSPWERVIDYKANYEKRELAHTPNNCPTKVDSTGWKHPTIKTTGWQPTCSPSNKLKTKPCTVLDPFFGSGTTAIVAYKHDRKFIGIELSQAYLDEIAIPRIEKATKQLKLW